MVHFLGTIIYLSLSLCLSLCLCLCLYIYIYIIILHMYRDVVSRPKIQYMGLLGLTRDDFMKWQWVCFENPLIFIGHFYFPCQDAEVSNGVFQAILYLFKYYKVSNFSTLHCKNYHICLWMQLPFSILTWYSSSLAAETPIHRPEYCNSCYLCFRVLYRILTQIPRNTKRKKRGTIWEGWIFYLH